MAAPRIKTRISGRRGARVDRTRANAGDGQAFTGPARLGRKTKLLVGRLGAEDVAIIAHEGIDRVAGEDLVASGVRHVVNVAQSASSVYANPGPMILTSAGVKLVDMPGAPLFDLIEEGQEVTLDGGSLLRDGEVVWQGEELSHEAVMQLYDDGRRKIGEALEAFADNTMSHIREERELLAGQLELPNFDTEFRDRPALVVVRGVDHKKDLRALRPYIRDVKPVIVAVDGGADSVLEHGFEPSMIVGDMDSASDTALRSGAELVVHAYPDGRAPGRERLDRLHLPYKVIPAPATSEDVAMLLAAERGANLIVTVGSHFNLVEFLDKNRAGMSSTFLTRLKVGEILVDAKGVSRLYRPSAGRGPILFVTLAALVTLVIIVATSPSLGPFLDLVWLKLEDLLGFE